MNIIATAIAVSAFISSAAATISFASPLPGSIWYTGTPNYLSIVSDNPDEISATVRFTNNRECFSLSVLTSSTVPVVLPRQFRSCNYLNIYAVSNLYGTASTIVNVLDSLCVTPGNTSVSPYIDSCAKPCAYVRRGCGYYASESSHAHHETSHSELVHIHHDSEEAKALQAIQDKATEDLAEDILAIQSSSVASELAPTLELAPASEVAANLEVAAEKVEA